MKLILKSIHQKNLELANAFTNLFYFKKALKLAKNFQQNKKWCAIKLQKNMLRKLREYSQNNSSKSCKGNLDQKKWLYFCYYLLAPKGSHKKCPTDLKFVATLLKSGPCFIFVTPFGTHSVIDNDKVIFSALIVFCKLFSFG